MSLRDSGGRGLAVASEAAEAAQCSGGWDGAETHRVPEDTRLKETLRIRLASLPAAGAARDSRFPSQPTRKRRNSQRPCALAVRQTLPLPAPCSAPDTRVPWSAKFSSFSASSRQVFWGAVLPEGPGVVWALAASSGVRAEVGKPGNKSPCAGGASLGDCASGCAHLDLG